MSIDNSVYEDLERPRGGQWVKLKAKGDTFEGTLVSIEVRDRTDPEGNVVLSRKTQKPRRIYRVTVQIMPDGPDDEGYRIFDGNESAQTAIQAAYKAVGTRELIGGNFKIQITAEAPSEYTQATYRAKFDPPAPSTTVDLPDTEEEPW